MESNWRQNVRQIGMGDYLYGVTGGLDYCTLAAELITPIVVSGATYRWVCQQENRFGTVGCLGEASTLLPAQCIGFFGTLGPPPFPYGFAVFPD